MDIHTVCTNTIKGLAIDAVQAANSGHPGAPMGLADVATVLWRTFYKHDPTDPSWPDRDRFVLSGGHGSMLMYSLLHLAGYDLSLDDIRQFRQLGSRTPGHPEVGHTDGVETTTGPLGQGIANAVGMALTERVLRETFGQELVDHRTWCICGDGDLMEGLSYEATSLAGHLALGRLVVLYDDNSISIDGSTDITFTEDQSARFEAAGWHVQITDGHDPELITAAIELAVAETVRPSIICCRTLIGHSSPLEGSNKTHGSPLGPVNVAATKATLGLDPEAFFIVPAEAKLAFREHNGAAARAAWQERLNAHSRGAELQSWFDGDASAAGIDWPNFEVGGKLATRKASAAVLKAAHASAPWIVGGSADLAGSNGTNIGAKQATPQDFSGVGTFNFGVREHGMAGIANGMTLHGGLTPYVATFLVFHDYMRPSVRLACLMKQQVIYIMTHDSVFLGEDGPTHQPIETLLAMRAIPGMRVLRPADASETVDCWKLALEHKTGPTALVLTRQGLPVMTPAAAGAVAKGAYVRRDCDDPAVVLVGTGSEVSLCLDAADLLATQGVNARVVSMPSVELFLAQDTEYRNSVLPVGVPRVSVEAGTTLGWARIVGDTGRAFGIDDFGLSAPASDIAEHLGFTPANIAYIARSVLVD
ncbi:MAG: transketolase [Kiritimatiellia bacterium]|jgi:transketolase